MFNIILGPDPNWAKIQDPDPNSMYSIWIHNTASCQVIQKLLVREKFCLKSPTFLIQLLIKKL